MSTLQTIESHRKTLERITSMCAGSRNPTRRIVGIYKAALRGLGHSELTVLACLEKLPPRTHDGYINTTLATEIAMLRNQILRNQRAAARGEPEERPV